MEAISSAEGLVSRVKGEGSATSEWRVGGRGWGPAPCRVVWECVCVKDLMYGECSGVTLRPLRFTSWDVARLLAFGLGGFWIGVPGLPCGPWYNQISGFWFEKPEFLVSGTKRVSGSVFRIRIRGFGCSI